MNIRFNSFNFCGGRRRNMYLQAKKSSKERGQAVEIKARNQRKTKQNKKQANESENAILIGLALRPKLMQVVISLMKVLVYHFFQYL